MEPAKLLKRLYLLKKHPDVVPPLDNKEMVQLAEAFLTILNNVKDIEKAIAQGKLKGDPGKDGKTPVPDRDYLSRREAERIIRGLFTDAAKRIPVPKDGRDAEITDEHISEAARLAYQMVELPNFEALITQEPTAIRDALELLQGDERLDKSAIKGLDELEMEFNDRISRIPAGGMSRNAVQALIDASGGGGGSSAWGDITGTLSAQTDLQTALNAKVENLTSFDTDDLSEGATNLYSQWTESGTDIVYSAGNVGVGRTPSSKTLEVQNAIAVYGTASAGNGVLVERASGGAFHIFRDDGSNNFAVYSGGSGKIRFLPAAVEALSAAYDGAKGVVGIGVDVAARKLEVLDTSGPQVRITYTKNTTYTDLQTTSSGYLYVNPTGGRVGIGTASPSEVLDVVGNAEINGNIIVTGTVDGRDIATDGTKLDGVEALADVTDQANVSAAGAPIISSGAGVPASTPSKVGDIYIDTTNDNAYIAVGTASSSDWEISNDGAGGGISDGDKGDITVSGSGATWTIDNGVVTYAKMQDISATSRILGRITAGAGDTEELTGANVRTITDTETTTQLNTRDTNNRARANHTGTQTASTISDFDTEVSNNTDVAANTAARHNAVTVTDSAEIDFTLTGQDITASLKAGSIDETKLDTSVNASLDLADSAVQNLTDLSITATATELNYSDGVTSNIQTQLDGKAATTTTINAQVGTTYTLVLADASKHVTMTNASANTLTVPPNASVAFDVGTRIMVQQKGAGSTTIAAGSGVTINAPASVALEIGEQYASRGLLKTATNTWELI